MDFLVLHEHVMSSWQRFVTGRFENLSEQLLERWRRVQQFGVDPEGSRTVESIAPEAQIQRRREQLEPLLRLGDDILDETAATFSEQNFVFLVAHRDGTVLKSLGGGEFADHARDVRLIEGAQWAEEVRGTNAIGTALAEERPTVIGGYAHFERVNHSLICYASPIRNPHGEVVAALDATSYQTAPNPWVQLAIHNAARALEEAWRSNYLDGLGDPFQSIQARVQSRREPSLFLTPGGRIKASNDAAQRLFQGPDTHVQSALHIPWKTLKSAVEEGQSSLTLDAEHSPNHQPLTLELEPLMNDDQLCGLAITLPSRPTTTVQPGPRTTHSPKAPLQRLFGEDPKLTRARRLGAQFASSTLPILLQAETGTGKNLLARGIHDASPRRNEPFITVNCGALTPDLLESELFGYGPGAFTGADPDGRQGHLAAADGGTLFLDEVAEMPPNLQVLLLQVLEDGTFSRVGEVTPRRVDFRLICATHRDLPALVRQGDFRSDLFFRINGASITLPPLRDRSDVVCLARHLLAELCADQDIPRPELNNEVEQWLNSHGWPGNIRELKNALHHALILSSGRPHLKVDDFPTPTAVHQRQHSGELTGDPPQTVEDAERHILLRARDAAQGNISEMARRLGVARTTVYRMLERHELR